MAKVKTMTMYKHTLTLKDMKTGADSQDSTLSIYPDAERVIKSAQSDAMKGGKVVIGAKKVEERKVTVDLEGAWNAAAPKAAPPVTPAK